MDIPDILTPLTIAGILGPTAAAGTALKLGAGAAHRFRSWKDLIEAQARRRKLLEGCLRLRTESEQWKLDRGQGEIATAWGATFSASQLPLVLDAFQRADAEDYLAPFPIFEPDRRSRDRCLRSIPPAFRDRVVVADFPRIPVGLIGDDVDTVMRHPECWWADAEAAADRWLDRLQRESYPGLLLAYCGPGGSAPLLLPALRKFKRRQPRCKIYLITILDEKTERRRNFPAMRRLYMEERLESGERLVDGLIAGDNRLHSESNDLGFSTLPAAMVAGRWVMSRPKDMWNALADVFRYHSLATISVWEDRIPLYYLPAYRSLPEVYYSKASLFEDKAIRGVLSLMSDSQLSALPLAPADGTSPRFCYVVGPIQPDPDMAGSARQVDASLNGRLGHDVSVQFASLGSPLRPDLEQANMLVVLLQPLKSENDLDALALGSPPPAETPIQ